VSKFRGRFVDGGRCSDPLDKLGVEGVVSKKIDSKYRSGRSRDRLKITTPTWR